MAAPCDVVDFPAILVGPKQVRQPRNEAHARVWGFR